MWFILLNLTDHILLFFFFQCQLMKTQRFVTGKLYTKENILMNTISYSANIPLNPAQWTINTTACKHTLYNRVLNSCGDSLVKEYIWFWWSGRTAICEKQTLWGYNVIVWHSLMWGSYHAKVVYTFQQQLILFMKYLQNLLTLFSSLNNNASVFFFLN